MSVSRQNRRRGAERSSEMTCSGEQLYRLTVFNCFYETGGNVGLNRCSTSGATLRPAAEPTTSTAATADLASSTAHVHRRATTSAGNAVGARPTVASAVLLRRHVDDVIVSVGLKSSGRDDRKWFQSGHVGTHA